MFKTGAWSRLRKSQQRKSATGWSANTRGAENAWTGEALPKEYSGSSEALTSIAAPLASCIYSQQS